jgi:hypothetical protein
MRLSPLFGRRLRRRHVKRGNVIIAPMIACTLHRLLQLHHTQHVCMASTTALGTQYAESSLLLLAKPDACQSRIAGVVATMSIKQNPSRPSSPLWEAMELPLALHLALVP